MGGPFCSDAPRRSDDRPTSFHLQKIKICVAGWAGGYVGRAWSRWAGLGERAALSRSCPRAERGPKGDPHIHAPELHGGSVRASTRREREARPDAFGALRGSRSALAPDLTGRSERASEDCSGRRSAGESPCHTPQGGAGLSEGQWGLVCYPCKG